MLHKVSQTCIMHVCYIHVLYNMSQPKYLKCLYRPCTYYVTCCIHHVTCCGFFTVYLIHAVQYRLCGARSGSPQLEQHIQNTVMVVPSHSHCALPFMWGSLRLAPIMKRLITTSLVAPLCIMVKGHYVCK
jgi:hypothetical protein